MQIPIGTKLGINNRIALHGCICPCCRMPPAEANDSTNAMKLPAYQYDGFSGSARLKET